MKFSNRRIGEREKSEPTDLVRPIRTSPDESATRRPGLSTTRRRPEQELQLFRKDRISLLISWTLGQYLFPQSLGRAHYRFDC